MSFLDFFHLSLESIGRAYASHDFVVVPYPLPNLIGDIFMFFYRKANVRTHVVVDEANENICKVVGN